MRNECVCVCVYILVPETVNQRWNEVMGKGVKSESFRGHVVQNRPAPQLMSED